MQPGTIPCGMVATPDFTRATTSVLLLGLAQHQCRALAVSDQLVALVVAAVDEDDDASDKNDDASDKDGIAEGDKTKEVRA